MRMDIFERMKKEGYRRNYSQKTIKAYIFWDRRFLKHCDKDHKSVSKKDAKDFLDHLIEKKMSYSSVNLAHSAIKFMLGILRKNWRIDFKYAKRNETQPEFMTRDEVRKLLSVISNRKHNLLCTLLYASGVRVGELVKLRVRDLMLDEETLWVRQGKGGKDRLTLTSKKLIRELDSWVKDNELTYDSFIFPGRNGYHISIRTIQQIVKKAAKKAKIMKNVHPHTFRHTFATHFEENNGDQSSLQMLLGHKNPETTRRYTHCAINARRHKSPFDEL